MARELELARALVVGRSRALERVASIDGRGGMARRRCWRVLVLASAHRLEHDITRRRARTAPRRTLSRARTHRKVFTRAMSDVERVKASIGAGEKSCELCGVSCVGMPRFKKRGSAFYRHRTCPASDDTARATTTTTPVTTMSEGGGARGGESSTDVLDATTDGVETDDVARSARAASSSRSPLGIESPSRRRRLARSSPRHSHNAQYGGGGGAYGGGALDDVSTVARALDETFRAWTIAVSREYPGMKNVLLASSAVYVGAAWLFVLPSAVKLAVEALSAALRVALAVVTLAGAGMFCAYAATRGHSRRARRVAARLRVVKRVALGFFDADEPHDEAPRTPPRTPPRTSSRFIDRLNDSESQERIEQLTAEKRAAERAREEANAMLSEASKTIEALRDALQATDAAREAEKRRLDDLARASAAESSVIEP